MRNVLYLFLFTIIACKPTQNEISDAPVYVDSSIGKYIMEYTQQDISVNEDIVFRFSGAVIEPNKIGTTVEHNTFHISPSANGNVVWKDMSTLVFTPDTPLMYNTTYVVILKLGSIIEDVPENLQKVQFPFTTKDLSFDMRLDKMKYDPIQDKLLTVTGKIKSSDFVKNEDVEEMVNVNQKGNKNVTINWSHTNNQKWHNFEISNIRREEQSSILEVEWKDKKYNSNFSGSRKLSIAAKDDFEVVAAEASRGNNRSITIYLTEPVKREQSLDGLIKIKDYKGKYKYDVSGSEIKVYPQQKVVSPFTIQVAQSIINTSGKKLEKSYSNTLSFDPIKPALRLAGKGVIVPHNDEIIFPFEAINLKGAKVEVFKIFEDNVLQFLQYNRLNTTYSLQAVGQIVHQQDINLSSINSSPNDASYVRYTLDLSKMINADPGAIYQIRIGFGKNDVNSYDCENEVPQATLVSKRDGFTSILTQPQRYNWRDRNDPCKLSYYNSSRVITRNVLGSNIGIIAKRDKSNDVHLILSDLKTVEPISGASVVFYDFQQQEIVEGTSGNDGVLKIQLDKKPAFAIIRSDTDFGYINLQDKYANSLSEFEVSGGMKKQGLDGYIYGERGVWRPGDTLFLNFVLEDKENKLPKNHPITMKVVDAKGKTQYNKTINHHVGYIYDFPVTTSESDPTGNWTATVNVGGTHFQKSLKVETVKPNRLKIQYDLKEDESIALYDDKKVLLESKWLHGAPANGLKAKVDMQIQSVKTTFKRYADFTFDDPARKVRPLPTTIFENNLSEQGDAKIEVKGKKEWLPPGKLRANFKTKVFEKGGNFSEDNFSVDADMYASYVGVSIPKTRWGSKFIKRNQSTDIPVVVVDYNGKPIANRNLKVGLYQADWNWWYNRGYSEKYQYNSSTHNGAVSKTTIQSNAKGEATYNVKFEEYGNYMLRICDEVTGHCTGDMFYTGYSWGSSRKQEGPQQLIFTTDKKTYTTDEHIEIKVPSNEGSKILVSIESGEKVLNTFWVYGQKGETKIDIPAEASMNSNVYLHVHLVQPHNNGANDLPMRMYGVVPISVVDKNTQINPEINMEDELRPGESYTVKVSEESGKPMSYTLAVVDEGLLDLTRYRTPDLWNHFFSKKALGVKTWDIYDFVLDGYGGVIDKLISIGGDSDGGQTKKGKKANRFVPVVTHLGPFYLEPGEENSHKMLMPNYVGSVKTMVVARNGMAYGKAEKATPVKKPLMILATLPRVLGPNEKLALPTNVFAMDEKVKNVNVSVETSENIVIQNVSKQKLTFDRVGDKQAYFEMEFGEEMGPANIKVRAQGHGEEAYDEVNINIRNPNPFTAKVYEATIEPGQSWEMDYELFGTKGSNEGVLELSNLPPMNFNKRLKYLIRYPYGCIEQTTSSVFPQLYLSEVTELDERTIFRIERNIKRAIERLSLFQLNSGGFSYWPGNNEVSNWGTNYALHFLIEAKEKGYYVPKDMIENAIKYQDKTAESYSYPDHSDYYWRGMTQAYRLYGLAKTGRANIGAMNVLKSYKHLNVASAHMLAASYALIGKKNIAQNLVANRDMTIKPYVETGYTYGSETRDLAMIAETHQIMGNNKEHAALIKTIAKSMSSNRWYSTQTTSYSLLALGKFLAKYEKGDLEFEYKINDEKRESGSTTKPSIQKIVEVESAINKKVSVKNNSKAILFVRYVLSGQLPPGGEEPASSKHINLIVNYTDLEGNAIDHTNIKQGTDFVAKVKIQNIGSRGYNIEEVALSQIFPSGWEIQNDRLSSMRNVTSNSKYDYRDVRDDRVYTFFDIRGTNTIEFSVLLNAAYAGKFYLSPVYVEAMYDNEIQAKTKGYWVEVSSNYQNE